MITRKILGKRGTLSLSKNSNNVILNLFHGHITLRRKMKTDLKNTFCKEAKLSEAEMYNLGATPIAIQ